MAQLAARAKDNREFVLNKTVPRIGPEPNLRTGDEFRESLRDGRHVIVNGRDVADVTEEASLARGIDQLARYFDAQHAPETQEQLTNIEPETGERISTAWLVPRSIEDLWRYDALIKCSTDLTFGTFGRPPDYGPVKAISFVAWNHLIRKQEPEALDKILNFMKVGRSHNLTSADIIIDVQVDRKLPMPQRASRLRVVEERKDGIVVSGAKAGNSVLAQGNIGSISMPPPNATMPEECMFWAAIPANVPGLKLLLREPTTSGTEDPEEHPIDAAGEESDGILIFDRVFIPWDYVFSYKNPITAGVALMFSNSARRIALGLQHISQTRLNSRFLSRAESL